MDIDYSVEFLAIAAHDLAEVDAHLSQFFEGTAGRFFEKFHRKLDLLSKTPKMYAAWPDNPDFRKFVVDNYLVFYRVIDEKRVVTICRILDGRRSINPDEVSMNTGV